MAPGQSASSAATCEGRLWQVVTDVAVKGASVVFRESPGGPLGFFTNPNIYSSAKPKKTPSGPSSIKVAPQLAPPFALTASRMPCSGPSSPFRARRVSLPRRLRSSPRQPRDAFHSLIPLASSSA